MAIKGIRVETDRARIQAEVSARSKEAVKIITNEFIKDANFYCRHDTGELIKSAIRASIPEKGLAIWDKPYAREVYYMGIPAKDKNPNARLEWARVAAEQHTEKYSRMFAKIMGDL